MLTTQKTQLIKGFRFRPFQNNEKENEIFFSNFFLAFFFINFTKFIDFDVKFMEFLSIEF